MSFPNLSSYSPLTSPQPEIQPQQQQPQITQAELQTVKKLNEYLEKFKDNPHVAFVREDFSKYLTNENKSTDEKLQALESTISKQNADMDEMKTMLAELLKNSKSTHGGKQ